MNRSQKLFQTAQQYFPGGVNSPVRSFRAVGGDPLFIEKGKGAYVWDVDGQRYIDYVLSWGPLVLGHAHPKVLQAIQLAAKNGTSFGASHQLEITLAQKIQKHYPHLQRMRFVSSGTEATMAAIRVARGFTKRNKIIKFSGCYHGHVDALLVEAGSGLATLGVPDSAGVTTGQIQDTLVAEYNDLDQVQHIFSQHQSEIAAVIVEPVVGNMGFVMPKPGFLEGLRKLCDQFGTVLIFDEVMTGFRIHLKGARAVFGVTADLTCLGKVVGGGLPVGVYGGKKEIMDCVAPLGPVYQAGTLSGNPVAMAAGLATISELEKPEHQKHLKKISQQLVSGMRENFKKLGKRYQVNAQGSMWGMYFCESPVDSFKTAQKSDLALFKTYFRSMLSAGVYLAPSQYEAGFLSTAHRESDIEKTLKIQYEVLKSLG
jgi:glutamate-1-semialdehyde 2,1-aminomutase